MAFTPKKGIDIIGVVGEMQSHFNSDLVIRRACQLHIIAAEPGDYSDTLSWVSEKKANETDLSALPAIGLLVVPQSLAPLDDINEQTGIVYSANPRQTFTLLLQQLVSMKRPAGIAGTAQIAPGAVIGSNCFIGHHVVIEDGVTIGDDVQILHNTVILQNTTICNRVTIGSNCTIGNYGFGYEKNAEGTWDVMPHTGGVFIDDDAEIHNNTCIDCGVMGNTYIGKNVKIDNQVHVAHGVTIEANSLIIANTVLGGNVVVGANSWVAPTSTIKNQIRLAPDTFTGLGAVVVKDTVSGSVMVGNPAEDMERYKKWSAVRKGLLGE